MRSSARSTPERASGARGAAAEPALFSQIAALRLHRIDGGAALEQLGAASKLNAAWPLVNRLHRLGAEAAADWLAVSASHLGRRSTLKLEAYL